MKDDELSWPREPDDGFVDSLRISWRSTGVENGILLNAFFDFFLRSSFAVLFYCLRKNVVNGNVLSVDNGFLLL